MPKTSSRKCDMCGEHIDLSAIPNDYSIFTVVKVRDEKKLVSKTTRYFCEYCTSLVSNHIEHDKRHLKDVIGR